jgi:hypothetical protein
LLSNSTSSYRYVAEGRKSRAAPAKSGVRLPQDVFGNRWTEPVNRVKVAEVGLAQVEFQVDPQLESAPRFQPLHLKRAFLGFQSFACNFKMLTAPPRRFV